MARSEKMPVPVKQIPIPLVQRPAKPALQLPTDKELKAMLKKHCDGKKVIYVIQHPSGHVRAFWRGYEEKLYCKMINTRLTSEFLVEPGYQLCTDIRDAIKRGSTKTLMGRCPKELL